MDGSCRDDGGYDSCSCKEDDGVYSCEGDIGYGLVDESLKL